MASRWGQVEMVEYLLNQGADPNKAGASWATPLSWAKRKGHIEVEQIFGKGRCNISFKKEKQELRPIERQEHRLHNLGPECWANSHAFS